MEWNIPEKNDRMNKDYIRVLNYFTAFVLFLPKDLIEKVIIVEKNE